MTLRQQLSLITSLLIVVLVAGNLMLMVLNSRDAFERQLNGRAYNAATSLALSMSQQDSDDDARLSRLMDVLFDRGFFSDIELQRVKGGNIHRHADQAFAHNPAPRWFMELVSFDLVPAEADVTRHWRRVGSIRVTSHSDYAYRDLWTMVKAELVWFTWVLVISLLLLHLFLGWLFRPLGRVEQQALAICEKDWQEQEDIPRARELRRVVLAMNQMVRKLRSIFEEQSAVAEKLREDSIHDAVTGLLNRRGFDQRMGHVLESEQEHSGLLVLLQLKEFSLFNLKHGRQVGDRRLCQIAQTFQTWQQEYSHSLCGRRSGADFAFYTPCADRLQAEEILQQVFAELASGCLTQRQQDDTLIFHMGGVFLQAQQESVHSALSRADAAMRQAQRHPQATALLYQQMPDNQQEWPAREWQQLLNRVLAEESIELQWLPVINNHNRSIVQYEVFSCILWQGQALSAARFWPMVEQHRMAAEFDLCIVQKVLETLALHINAQDDSVTDTASRFCINLSPASVMDEAFHSRLVRLLQLYPQLGKRLAFEIPEFALANTESALARLALVLKPFGSMIGIDQVGTGSMAFAYLQRLPLDYVRIDGSFNRGLHQAQDHRFFVQSMVQIAHNLDLLVLGEGLEEGRDVDTLRSTGVDGMSGYYFSRPMSDFAESQQWQP